jgi:hypothetical protein
MNTFPEIMCIICAGVMSVLVGGNPGGELGAAVALVGEKATQPTKTGQRPAQNQKASGVASQKSKLTGAGG